MFVPAGAGPKSSTSLDSLGCVNYVVPGDKPTLQGFDASSPQQSRPRLSVLASTKSSPSPVSPRMTWGAPAALHPDDFCVHDMKTNQRSWSSAESITGTYPTNVQYQQVHSRVRDTNLLDCPDCIRCKNISGCRVCDAKTRPVDRIYRPGDRTCCAYPANFRVYDMMKNPDGRVGYLFRRWSSTR